MSKLDIKAYRIDTLCNHGYWQDRALSQIKFAAGLSALRGGKYDGLVESAETSCSASGRQRKPSLPTPPGRRRRCSAPFRRTPSPSGFTVFPTPISI